MRRRGGIVVVVAHRPSALIGLDKVMALAKGRVQALGPRDEVLKSVLRGPQPVAPKRDGATAHEGLSVIEGARQAEG